jgi:hypothetical protein
MRDPRAADGAGKGQNRSNLTGRRRLRPTGAASLNLKTFLKIGLSGLLAAALFTSGAQAQHLTLEGQTGGFLTPTAFVVESDKGFSHPAVGYHFIGASKVIGDVQTVSITEGFANRAEVGYTRSVHLKGDSAMFSSLWDFSGMNIFHGKAVVIKDGEFKSWLPGIAVGGVVRTGDHFVTGALDGSTYTNGDVYVAATKLSVKPPVPFMVNFGWKATNASIFGLGGQSTRFGGRIFGGLGMPLPGPWKTAIVPSAGFTQEPATVKNLGAASATSVYLIGGRAHVPTTMDYAVRVTQAEHPHFSFDIGIGQVAGNIGTTLVSTGVPANPYTPLVINLQARHVLGMGLSYRY